MKHFHAEHLYFLLKSIMLNPWYITGFADGEAAFTYSRQGGTFALYFAIKQREDNQKIVEEIQRHFDFVGDIYKGRDKKGSFKAEHTKPSFYYRVTRINELKRIMEHFDKYPLQSEKKQEVYNVWREMVMHKLENYRKVDYDKLRSLAERLSHLNSQSRVFKVHKK
ncbi:MAG: LAGLIDADG family homing endonuclease [Candidatus Omnitrophota bacterium]